MERSKPLDELEMFDLLRAAYPEKFTDESDATFEAAMEFADDIEGWGEIADLLGRVAMLTMPMESGLTRQRSHCLGVVTITESGYQMVAAVRRDA